MPHGYPIIDETHLPHKLGKAFRYSVGVYHTERHEENGEDPELFAKFRSYGDAYAWAARRAEAPLWCAAVVIVD